MSINCLNNLHPIETIDFTTFNDIENTKYEKSSVFQGQDSKRYAFRCRAMDTAGNLENYPQGEMAATAVDISAPPPIAQLRAVPMPGGDIELKWSPVEDKVSGTDFYRVYRWVEGEKKRKISTDGEVKGVTYLDKGGSLRENIVYYYSVHAVRPAFRTTA